MLYIIIAAIVGAFLFRLKGSGWTALSRQVLCAVIALPFALICYPHWIVMPVVFLMTFASLCTGHGQYFLPPQTKFIKPEKVDFIPRFFFGRDPRTVNGYPVIDWVLDYGYQRLFCRSVYGMSITGLIVTLPAGLALHSPLLALSGLLKGPAYALGNTERAEWITGAIYWGTLAFIVVRGG